MCLFIVERLYIFLYAIFKSLFKFLFSNQKVDEFLIKLSDHNIVICLYWYRYSNSILAYTLCLRKLITSVTNFINRLFIFFVLAFTFIAKLKAPSFNIGKIIHDFLECFYTTDTGKHDSKSVIRKVWTFYFVHSDIPVELVIRYVKQIQDTSTGTKYKYHVQYQLWNTFTPV